MKIFNWLLSTLLNLGTARFLRLFLLVFTGSSFILQVKAKDDSFRVVGYFVNWYNPINEARDLDYSKVTHLNWAFINILNAQGDLENETSDFSALDTLVAHAHANGVKVCMSLGGGDLGNAKQWYIDLNAAGALSSEARGEYIHKYVAFIEKHQLDGIDVDLEMDNIKKGPYDYFIAGLVDSLRPKGKLITAALNGSGNDNFNDSTIAKFDWINIMSYDWTGSWTPNDPGQHSSYEQAVIGISGWTKRGAKKEQLNVGVPFYGHAFLDHKSYDYANYNVILGRFPDAYQKDSVGNIIYYNGIPTIQRKTALAIEKAGGIMIWALQYDVSGSKSLLKAINDARTNYNANNMAPTVTIASPSVDTIITSDKVNIVAFTNDNDGVYQKTKLWVNGVALAEGFTGQDTLKLENLSSGNYHIIAQGIDYQFKSGYDTVNITVNQEIPRSAYNDIIGALPGKIEAENYDIGVSELIYKDVTSGNAFKLYRADDVDVDICHDIQGGFCVSNASTGEWIEYSINVADTGDYDFEFRVASLVNGTIAISIDGVDKTGIINVPKLGKTGSIKNWKSVYASRVSLNKGEHIMRVNFLSGNTSLNYIKAVKSGPVSILENQISFLKLFPNPANDVLKIQSNVSISKTVNFELVNVNGSVIKSQILNIEPNIEHTINIEGLEPGIYFINVYENNNCYTERFVKQ